MNFCKALEEQDNLDGSGTVLFYVDSSSRNIVYAIDGQDNKKYYSFNGVKDGVLAYPNKLNYWDMWFTQSHSLPEIKGFIKLANESQETFKPKTEELETKFDRWGKDTLYGKIPADRQSIIILGDKKDLIPNLLSFFVTGRIIDSNTFVYEDNNPKGKVSELLVSTESPMMIFEERSIPRKDVNDDSWCTFAQSDYAEDVETLNLVNKYKLHHDNDAAEKLLEKYQGIMHSLLNKYGNFYKLTPDTKEDVLQECYIKFLTKLTEYDASKGKLSTYVYVTIDGLIRNTINKEIQTLQRESPHSPKPSKDENTEKFDFNNQQQSREEIPGKSSSVQDVINELPEREKLIINSYFYEHKTLDDIAQELGTSKQYVHQILNKTLDLMRSKLQDVEAIKLAMIFNKLGNFNEPNK